MQKIANQNSAPELWGGLECTVNRVGNSYFDQCIANGHETRFEDLDLFAELGIKALRYPVLWERTWPDPDQPPNWDWPDARLTGLRERGIRPIVGLVHHGSGPMHTSLLDPQFPEKLAGYARLVAERYPWVEDYTPVNEPLTTARFSGLYGHWYPHYREERAFLQMLLTQCRAVALAMRAVREVNPNARLIQTDDLGKTYSTPPLAYQAEFENERRWLSWDLLCGKVHYSHPLRGYLYWAGIRDEEMDWFLENPCPPDVIGINYYATSERFLDDRYEKYPTSARGGNGRQTYADVEALRVCATGTDGPKRVLNEAWERYHLPLAITEAHLGCTREEQMRWLRDVWNAACEVRREGVKALGVTVWALLGSHDWNNLLTRRDGSYEPGVFDLRGPTPRPTALAGMMKRWAQGKTPDHPVLDAPGWWKRPDRLIYEPTLPGGADLECAFADVADRTDAGDGQPDPRLLLLLGDEGALTREFERLCRQRGLPLQVVHCPPTDAASLAELMGNIHPWAVINAIQERDAQEKPSATEFDAGFALHKNWLEQVEFSEILARACRQRQVPLLLFSSACVFDGAQETPYVESDPLSPACEQGRAQVETERRVLSLWHATLIVREGILFGPYDDANPLTVALLNRQAGKRDEERGLVSLSYITDIVHASLDLLIDGERGVWHLANPDARQWTEIVNEMAERAAIVVVEDNQEPAREGNSEPRSRSIASERGTPMPPLSEALNRYWYDRWRK